VAGVPARVIRTLADGETPGLDDFAEPLAAGFGTWSAPADHHHPRRRARRG
jgi:hypothetical protein